MGKMMFIDLTRCTACRGCQVACKQWKSLPGEATRNTGTHQNPPDLSFNTLKLVRFSEPKVDGKLHWLFFPDACRHCLEPPCMGQANLDDEGAVIQDEATGAVIFTDKIANADAEAVRTACPYDIPRPEKDGKMSSKCDFCIDRISNGMKPSCVHVCPTGCMNFGTEEEMRALAKTRLEEVKKHYPQATLGNDDVRVMYLFAVDPKNYSYNAVAEAAPTGPMTRREVFASLAGKPKA
ncbi:4Fe-4S dicluster domain-containing protein [Desulfovibrio cuneatus]|uniref:4Fe-4S dicluster domain-containing protein n=1 Tax=Desulfovibrio cuneatus TaxID=159728 RepID=UPI0004040040|nr:4Fe-4S dicluster domain-containing protein [Desulfovibrio cuneatus]